MPTSTPAQPTSRIAWLAALALAAVLAAAACGGGGDDSSDAMGDQAASTPASDTPTEAAPDQAEAAPDSGEAEPAARQTGDVEGIVFDVGEGSESTFTVEEQLARLPVPNDAVMRTGAVSGEVRLDGGPSSVQIELTQLLSDQGFRDRYVRTRMFGSHPVATFAVDDVGELPAGFAAGDTVNTSVDGTLSLLGSEFPLSFQIEARDDGHTVFVLGSAEFTWEQFGIPIPTAPSVVWVADEVKVQVLLELVPRQGG